MCESCTPVLVVIIRSNGFNLTNHRISHRVADTGRDLWRSPDPIPLLKQGHLEAVAQDHVRMAFDRLQGRKLHNLSGQPVPVLGHPDSKKAFPDVQREQPVFQFVLIAFGAVMGHH